MPGHLPCVHDRAVRVRALERGDELLAGVERQDRYRLPGRAAVRGDQLLADDARAANLRNDDQAQGKTA